MTCVIQLRDHERHTPRAPAPDRPAHPCRRSGPRSRPGRAARHVGPRARFRVAARRHPHHDALVVVRPVGHQGRPRARDAPDEGRRHRRFRDPAGLSRRRSTTRRGLRDAPVSVRRVPRRTCASPPRRPASWDCASTSRSAAAGRTAGRRSPSARPPASCGSSASRCLPAPTRVPVPDIRAGEALIAAFLAPSAPATTTKDLREVSGIADGVMRLPDRAPQRREVLFFISSRTGMMVKRPAVGAEGFVLNHYDRAAVDHYLAAVGDRLLSAFGSRSAVRRLLRQPRGVRVRLDRRLPRRVQGAPRLRPAAAPARARPRRRAGDRRDPPRLGPDAHRARRRAVPRADAGVGGQARHAVPHPGLRHSARHDLEQRAASTCPKARARSGRRCARRAGRRRSGTSTTGPSSRPRPGRGSTRPSSGPRRST